MVLVVAEKSPLFDPAASLDIGLGGARARKQEKPQELNVADSEAATIMPVDTHHMPFARDRGKRHRDVVKNRGPVVDPVMAVLRIDRVERAPQGEIAVHVFRQMEDDHVTRMTDVEELAACSAQKHDKAIAIELVRQTTAYCIEGVVWLCHPDHRNAPATACQNAHRDDR